MALDPNMEIRHRQLLLKSFYGRSYFMSGGNVYSDTGYVSRSFKGTQSTASEGHEVSLLGETLKPIGGPFETSRVYIGGEYDPPTKKYPYFRYVKDSTTPSSVKLASLSSLPRFYFEGQLLTPVRVDSPVLRPKFTSTQLRVQGTEAIDRCKPTSSLSDAGTALLELRNLKELPHSIPGIASWKERTRAAKAAGSEYLAAQFGYLPLIEEIGNTIRVARKSQRLLAQLLKDEGKPVRRSYRFPIVDETVIEKNVVKVGFGGLGLPSPSSYHYEPLANLPNWDLSTRTRKAVTFSGSFTYSLGSSKDRVSTMVRSLQEFDYLYGVVPTPDVLWALAPWSWAIDWFVNLDSILGFVSDALLYGLVLNYGYVMGQTITSYTYSTSDTNLRYRRGPHVGFTSHHEVKQREEASPFGFGLTWDGLDPFQLSIIAALGITRS